MNAPNHDPWQERLSEYVDGELDARERSALEAHLEGCEGCRALLGELREIVAAARGLEAREPARDLWSGVEAALEPRAEARAWPRHVLAFAAGVLATLGALYAAGALGKPADTQLSAGGERYLLLLREPEGFGSDVDEAEHAARVERYARWAGDLGARCVAGEELEDGGERLRPGAEGSVPLPSGPRVAGFFLLDVRDRAEALQLAESCPHLELGGSIDVRRIRTHERGSQ